MSPRTPRLRIAVVGQGHFAQVAVLPGLAHLKDVEIAALISDSPEKLTELGERYQAAHLCGYDEYDSLLESGQIDAVCIVLPNDLHAEYTIRAARHKVHVFCEKPMAVNEQQCLEMIRACDEAGVKLMIGYRLHFEPSNLTAVEAIKRGDLGDPRIFDSVFTLQAREGNIRVQPRPGAGPLFDIGIYCINASRYLFRDEPEEVLAIRFDRSRDARFEHVEEAAGAILRFPNNRAASFVCSFGAVDRSWYQVIGTAGRLELDNAYEYAVPRKLVLVKDGRPKVRSFRKLDQIAAELEYFVRCIRRNVEPEPSGYEGLADVRILEGIQRSAAEGRAIPLVPVRRDRRPDKDQEITKPAHGMPRVVDVESGSQ